MNKELIQQFLIRACWDGQDQYELEDWLKYELEDWLNVEKFAELIVRECIRIDVENPDAAPGVEIAKHFEVEL
jgi:hypothetical protein